jgi:hypothetical protein
VDGRGRMACGADHGSGHDRVLGALSTQVIAKIGSWSLFHEL